MDELSRAASLAADPAPHRARFPFIARQFPPFTPRQWRVFGISTTAGFFDFYDAALLSLALKQIQQGLGIAEARLGGMMSAIRMGYVASLAISPLADVFGRRRLLLYTIIGYTLFTALSAIAPHQGSFVAAQFMTRAFSGAEATVSLVILVEEVDAAVRGWALGMQGALAISGFGLAAIVFSTIAIIPFGWRGLYALALAPLVLIIPIRRILPESRRFESERAAGLTPNNPLEPLMGLLRAYPGRFAIVVTVLFFYFMGSATANFFVPKFLQEMHHWTPGRVSSLYVFGGAIGILGNVVAGRTSDRFGRRRMGAIYMALGSGLALCLYTGGIYSAGMGVVALWVTMLFCDQATQTLMNTYGAELFPTSQRAAALGAIKVMGYVGGSMGLLLEGVLYGVARSHWGAIRLLTAPWLAAAVAMYILFPETAGQELEAIAPEAR